MLSANVIRQRHGMVIGVVVAKSLAHSIEEVLAVHEGDGTLQRQLGRVRELIGIGCH
jgi:hypothetical protein